MAKTLCGLPYKGKNYSIKGFVKWLKRKLQCIFALQNYSIEEFVKWLKQNYPVPSHKYYYSIEEFVKWLKLWIGAGPLSTLSSF